MSAFIVTKNHIAAIVQAGLDYGPCGPMTWWNVDNPRTADNAERHELRHENASEVGSMLWAENLASVAYRYPDDVDGERPGPVGFVDADVVTYRHAIRTRPLSPLAILKAIAGYEYQSCEHPGWHDSEARQFCQALRLHTISTLSGYDTASWEID